jgi:hypothetical protein
MQFSVALRFHCSSNSAVVIAVVGRRTSTSSSDTSPTFEYPAGLCILDFKAQHIAVSIA